MNKQQIETMIDEMEDKLEETKDAVGYNRGPLKDAMMLSIPMMQDQLKIMRGLLEITPDLLPDVVVTQPEPVQMQKVVHIMKSIDGHEPVLLDWTEKQAQVGAGLYPEHILFFTNLPEGDES